MVKLSLIDKPEKNGESGEVEIRLVSGDDTFAYPVKYYPSPITDDFRKELQWYFEEYLLHPYGKNIERAKKAASDIKKFGKEMGQRLFGEGRVRDVILEKLDRLKLQNVLVTLESTRPEFFQEPWEILLLPERDQCLSTSCSGFVRSLPEKFKPETQLQLGKENPLRVLMVISRPSDLSNLPFRATARGVFQKLLEFERSVEIEVLRPPTWEALRKRLNNEVKPVHILHFDGHGDLQSQEEGPALGVLAFEDDSGKTDCRDTESLAQLAGGQGVEMVFLDSCRGAAMENSHHSESLQAAMATGLIHGGIKGVVAMTWTSYTFTTSECFESVYANIAEGKSLARAVVESRQAMKLADRKSVLTSRELEFHDWPVPVHYGLRDIRAFSDKQETLPLIKTNAYGEVRKNLISFRDELLEARGFFGRDREFHAIESAFRKGRIALAHGYAGIGKTHLSHQFASWYVASLGAEKAFYFNYESEAWDKDRIVQLIGRTLDGDGAGIRSTMDKLLHQRFLLVLDNFETVTGLGGTEGSLADKERTGLLEFLREAGRGRTRVLIGSRGREEWIPNDDVYYVDVKGLTDQERREFGAVVLKESGLEEKEGDQEHIKLLDYLEGHPYLTQKLLPRLRECSAKEILEEFGREMDSQAKGGSVLQADSMFALFEFGWKRLPQEWRPIFCALADLKGFITDALPVAFDTKEEEEADWSREFFEALNVPKPEYMEEVFKAGEKAGFYVRQPLGWEVHPAGPQYLAAKRKELGWTEEKRDQIGLCLSKIYCEELAILCNYFMKNAQSPLLPRVGQNQTRWRGYLEHLWHQKEYNIFSRTVPRFGLILQSLGIADWLYEMCSRLIQDLDISHLPSPLPPDFAKAWLLAAKNAIDVKGASDTTVILRTVQYWRDWIQSPDNEDTSYFNDALKFFGAYYSRTKNWNKKKEISLISLSHNKKKQFYMGILSDLDSLAICEQNLENVEECRKYENIILNEIPYEKTSAGMKPRLFLNVATRRMIRGEFEEALSLLEELKELPDAKSGVPIHVLAMEARIYFLQSKFEKAMEISTGLWQDIVNGKHQLFMEEIAGHLMELEAKLGHKKFTEIYQRIAPGVAPPSAVFSKQK
ncbi:MAG: CHAT domain-containing protein [Nitrospinae bacterium]|nr:CHAT domain-containing protein [Nitrospinota bacterium]